MDVILLERIEKLGKMGEVVAVKPGYARNYLLPQKKAVRATAENRDRFEQQRAQLEELNLARRADAEQLAPRLQNLRVDLIRQAGEAGQLYGSVSPRDIADAVGKAGWSVRRDQVRLNQPIKALGLYDVPVALHPEVTISVRVNVARSPDEAEIQARTGAAATGATAAEEAEEQEEEAVTEEDAAALGAEPFAGDERT
jgi:large subunit ribosomal protein L9